MTPTLSVASAAMVTREPGLTVALLRGLVIEVVGGGGGIDVKPKPEITIEGLQVIVRVEEVMNTVREMIEQKTEPPPEGWITTTALSKELRSSTQTINPIIDQYREKRPEWFQSSSHRWGELISPELVQELKNRFGVIRPEGWHTPLAIRKETGESMNRIKKIAEGYRESHPDWFATFRSTNGSWEHYAPPLVELIAQELEKQKTSIAPDGWMNIKQVCRNLELSESPIKKIAEEYREEHPEWFKIYQLSQKLKQNYEHYAPELVQKIEQRIAQRKSIPLGIPFGWMNPSNLTQYRGDGLTIKRIADEYRELHPEWFGQYRNKGNNIYEVYSPELVAEIKKRLGMET